jgi:hypothetical protein
MKDKKKTKIKKQEGNRIEDRGRLRKMGTHLSESMRTEIDDVRKLT